MDPLEYLQGLARTKYFWVGWLVLYHTLDSINLKFFFGKVTQNFQKMCNSSVVDLRTRVPCFLLFLTHKYTKSCRILSPLHLYLGVKSPRLADDNVRLVFALYSIISCSIKVRYSPYLFIS
jgi:hypothetical protein